MKPESWLAWLPVATRVLALLGVAYEILIEELDRPYLLMLLGAMLGLTEIATAIRTPRKNGNGDAG